MRLLALAVACFAAGACAHEPSDLARPAWLAAKIAEYERLPVANPPRSIHRATWKGGKVFYVPPICCDIPSEVYDEKGTLLCYASGGFAGGDGRCPGFAAEGMTLLWQDPRGAANVSPR